MYRRIIAAIYTGLVVGWFFISQVVTMSLFVAALGKSFSLDHQYLIMLIAYGLFFCGLWAIEKVYPVKEDVVKSGLVLKGIKEPIRFIVYGIGLWVIASILNGILLPLFPKYPDQISSLLNNNEPVLCFIALVIGGPIVEEYLFRGNIQSELEKAFGSSWAVILQGIVFGFVHPFGLQRIYASVIGIGFGYVRKRENRLIASIIMHMTINFIGWAIGVMATYQLG